MAGNLERKISPDELLESFVYNKEISNSALKPNVTSHLIDAKASVSNKSPNGWAAHCPTTGEAKFGRKIAAGAGGILHALFGTTSPAALATTVGVLTEVPVMLFLCYVANNTKRYF